MSQDINLIQSGMIHPHYLHSAQHSAKTRVLHLIRTRYLAQTHLSTHTLTAIDTLLTADTRVPYPDGARVPAHAVAAARVAHAVLQHLAAVAPQARAEEE